MTTKSRQHALRMIMRFIIDGESFELTPELVRSRLADQHPEEVREYWVEINGACWPVKQALELATSAKRSRFVSTTARRHFERLGFPIGTGSASSDVWPGSQSARPRAAFHVDSLPVLESLEIRVSFRWRSAGPVTLDAAGLPRFPVLPGAPGLYRFDFGPDELGVRAFYIGESKSVRRRNQLSQRQV
jgi:hypothetical protein